ncbi:CmpA/NrtA family ABC transporter substrate-binding protein [Methylocystis bryophila]|uniref:Nitrate transporter n=1 Tax=Methylocystis bryophila TaxID=655015 RepID=A0A1W6MXP4_9HYPH|nr:CmpA/NrtA family ABC transporter substrate-binding protein [Methylocystis bryophila]ARN82333.1 nitrate transporter [Methylocystis bryophila]BDV38485.1 nitrate transporter [Methylocystis bryophila]
MTGEQKLRIGFMPLVDAAALIVAVDKGFASAEGLEVELVREASWSNIRDKLAIGHFDAAHLLAPMAIASTLGLGHVKVPFAAPLSLATNGNAITLSPSLFEEMRQIAGCELESPMISARALGDLVRRREAQGLEPLTFGMTFPFSTHNYQLRYWMAEGGIDPDRDLRLVVLPPPFMADSLREGHVDGFCVGAPWNSVAVDASLGVILHFGCEIFPRAAEKVLALRGSSVETAPELVAALIRAIVAAAKFVDDVEAHSEVASILAREDRLAIDAELIKRSLEGRLIVNAKGDQRRAKDYLVIHRDGACRPSAQQAAWLYAQMLRWGQARHSAERLAAAKAVMRADLYDSVIGEKSMPPAPIEAFAGPAFDSDDIAGYLQAFPIGQKI